MTTQHRHRGKESREHAADGMCNQDGCVAAHSVSFEQCSCGAWRKICHGMGARRHKWQEADKVDDVSEKSF